MWKNANNKHIFKILLTAGNTFYQSENFNFQLFSLETFPKTMTLQNKKVNQQFNSIQIQISKNQMIAKKHETRCLTHIIPPRQSMIKHASLLYHSSISPHNSTVKSRVAICKFYPWEARDSNHRVPGKQEKKSLATKLRATAYDMKKDSRTHILNK